MKDQVRIWGIETSVPRNSYTQSFALEFLTELQGETKRKREFLEKVYSNTGIEKRHTVIDDYGKEPQDYSFYAKNSKMLPEPTLRDRNQMFAREAKKLSFEASNKLFTESCPFLPNDITHIITVSCTGFIAPGIDQHLVNALGLSRNVHRYNIGFMGCYAAFPALKLSCDICKANPNACVLIVCIELCTLHFQQKFHPETVVANAIFADGAAAALVSSVHREDPGSSLQMHDFQTDIISDSESDMAWSIGEHAFDMRLSLYVPQLIEENIRSIVESQLNKIELTLQDVSIWAIHPGGRAILDKIRDEFGLSKEDLAPSYDTLKNFGNMSSSTIFFVLKEILNGQKTGQIYAAAFGPGLTVESGLFLKE